MPLLFFVQFHSYDDYEAPPSIPPHLLPGAFTYVRDTLVVGVSFSRLATPTAIKAFREEGGGKEKPPIFPFLSPDSDRPRYGEEEEGGDGGLATQNHRFGAFFPLALPLYRCTCSPWREIGNLFCKRSKARRLFLSCKH